MAGLKVSPASNWGIKAELVELPSGNVARLKERPNLIGLVRAGVLDSELLVAFDEAARGELSDPKLAVQLQDAIVREMFVEPRVVLDPADASDDAVLIDALVPEDIEFVIALAFGGAPEDDARFRGNGRGADAGDGGEDVGQKPKRSPRATKRKSPRVPDGQTAGASAS